MKLCLAGLATALAAFALPAAASAATLRVDPPRPCYGSGETVHLLGTGFTPNLQSGIRVTKDGQFIGPLSTDPTGSLNGLLTLGQRDGKRTSTYTATDTSNPGLTASDQITVSEVDVRLRPSSGAPGRLVTIGAVGFTTGGPTLWAHVVRRGRVLRHIKIGRLQRACHKLEKKRRLLRQNAALGVYTVQFDAHRKYVRRRAQSVRFTITVVRRTRPASSTASAASVGWSRLF
jgi:hypothetical protein